MSVERRMNLMTAENLIAMTVRLESTVAKALAWKAKENGQEVADYAGDVLTQDVIENLEPTDAARIQAELEVKAKAIAYAQDIAYAKDRTAKKFDEHVTLKVFQHIRENDHLRGLYERGIGARPGADRGNHIKARVNRTLGAAIKTAVGAIPKTENGNVLRAQVEGEFIRSYTLLEPDTGKKRAA
jgi:hypothetical protein